MAPPRRSRFQVRGDAAARRAEEEAIIAGFEEEPLNDSPEVADATAALRESVMRDFDS